MSVRLHFLDHRRTGSSHGGSREGALWGHSSLPDLITSQRPHLPTPSPWGEGFNTGILGRHSHSGNRAWELPDSGWRRKGAHRILGWGQCSSARWRVQGNSTSEEMRVTQVEYMSVEPQETGRPPPAAQPACPGTPHWVMSNLPLNVRTTESCPDYRHSSRESLSC